MSRLSAGAIAHLQTLLLEPDLTGTPYSLVRRLGEGGMGIVWLAHDERLAREVAIKVTAPGAPDPGTDPYAARLAREARLLARLEHPGIVPVHDAGVLPDGRTYSVMKLVRGVTLDEWVGTPAAATLSARLRLFRKICDPVAWAHEQGIIHRDLKPENVMVGPFGEALVMDWGAGRTGGGGAEGERGVVVGTHGYMAPEQARGEADRTDHRADIWSLGALLRFLLRDAPPARAMTAILGKAQAGEPAARYDSVMALAEDVERYLDGQPVSAHRETILEQAGRLLRRNREMALLIAAYLAVRILVLIVGGY